ncbi:MAG: 4Fe-4S binding protein [Bacteroidetes bacterium]|nr:4Fe-4S binding protein [Bacteroidota bacterium]MCL5737817.1 4Fe-4S binding protein [Bacteroidota bacterium]
MDIYRINTSETFSEPPVKVVQLKDGPQAGCPVSGDPSERKVKKIVDKSYLRTDRSEIRSYVQFLFFLLTLWIGIDFYLFVNGLEKGIVPTVQRPPGVEGFLPISALISLRYFILTGIVNHVHPSGFFIFVAALLISTLMKKGFCSWICPVGYISESLHQLGAKIFRRNFVLPKWIDIPLRSLKYLLMAFFLITVSTLSVIELDGFIRSDYNKIADIKMYMFFAHISTFSLAVIGTLIFLSLFYKNFWCRYACPYGALLGITSLISPLKIRRIDQTCIDCGKCTDACPSLLPVDKLDVVNSAECTACYSCVEVCPVKNTLKFSVSAKSKGLSQRQYAFLLIGVYFGIVGVAMLVGLWQNSISGAEYLELFRNIGAISHAL